MPCRAETQLSSVVRRGAYALARRGCRACFADKDASRRSERGRPFDEVFSPLSRTHVRDRGEGRRKERFFLSWAEGVAPNSHRSRPVGRRIPSANPRRIAIRDVAHPTEELACDPVDRILAHALRGPRARAGRPPCHARTSPHQEEQGRRLLEPGERALGTLKLGELRISSIALTAINWLPGRDKEMPSARASTSDRRHSPPSPRGIDAVLRRRGGPSIKQLTKRGYGK